MLILFVSDDTALVMASSLTTMATLKKTGSARRALVGQVYSLCIVPNG